MLSLTAAAVISGCGQAEQPDKPYTGIMRLKDGTEFAALEMPTSFGGACKGWNRLEIRGYKAGTGTGTSTVACWKSEGENIIVRGQRDPTFSQGRGRSGMTEKQAAGRRLGDEH